MKIIYSLTIFFLYNLFNPGYGQNSAEKPPSGNLKCDSIFFLNGDVVTCQVQEIRKNKVIYFLCCPQCAVPREFYIKDIDTIIRFKSQPIQNEDLTINSNNVEEIQSGIDPDSISSALKLNSTVQILMLRRKIGNKKNVIITEGQRITVRLKNGTIKKGKLSFSSSKDILVGNQKIELEDLVSLAKHSKGWRIAGGISGTAATLTTFWLSGFSLPIVFIPASATLFTLMIVKRNYDLSDKYDIYHLY